ncbi:hypothetical protein BGZ83_007644 [Gryganskiella cystojenkinii]|nr:hypothetical protein BGZ83_007644 [Gryganskiella cystojenkinii]
MPSRRQAFFTSITLWAISTAVVLFTVTYYASAAPVPTIDPVKTKMSTHTPSPSIMSADVMKLRRKRSPSSPASDRGAISQDYRDGYDHERRNIHKRYTPKSDGIANQFPKDSALGR